MKRIATRTLLTAGLTGVTLGAIYRMKSDIFFFPGYFVAWVFYPGGVHDHHGYAWWLVATLSTMSFYAVLWYVALSLLRIPRKRVT